MNEIRGYDVNYLLSKMAESKKVNSVPVVKSCPNCRKAMKKTDMAYETIECENCGYREDI